MISVLAAIESAFSLSPYIERNIKEQSGQALPVGHRSLSDLDGAQLLVVCAGQAEAALLPVASGAARAKALWRRGQGGGA